MDTGRPQPWLRADTPDSRNPVYRLPWPGTEAIYRSVAFTMASSKWPRAAKPPAGCRFAPTGDSHFRNRFRQGLSYKAANALQSRRLVGARPGPRHADARSNTGLHEPSKRRSPGYAFGSCAREKPSRLKTPPRSATKKRALRCGRSRRLRGLAGRSERDLRRCPPRIPQSGPSRLVENEDAVDPAEGRAGRWRRHRLRVRPSIRS
jgi:hypothetical protein